MDHQKHKNFNFFNVNSLPLYCSEQCPKVPGKSYEKLLNYAPKCGDGDGDSRDVVPKQAFSF